jgi:flagellar biosynthesis/type III secretory pathway protein FliH
MPEFVEKYINPFTDYGFKRLFGEEPNKELKESIFMHLFEVAEIAKFSKEEADAYEESLKSYRDLKNSLDTAYEEGMEKGREEEKKKSDLEKRQIISNLIEIGLDTGSISKATGYTEQEIEEIRKGKG